MNLHSSYFWTAPLYALTYTQWLHCLPPSILSSHYNSRRIAPSSCSQCPHHSGSHSFCTYTSSSHILSPNSWNCWVLLYSCTCNWYSEIHGHHSSSPHSQLSHTILSIRTVIENPQRNLPDFHNYQWCSSLSWGILNTRYNGKWPYQLILCCLLSLDQLLLQSWFL